MNKTIESVTHRVIRRSRKRRLDYEAKCQIMRDDYPPKKRLSCGNFAHAYAACTPSDKQTIRSLATANLGIITAYNDMLSAHQPLATYPDIIRAAARAQGCSAQLAAGVPAMCDGITQGQVGMELSLFSRDVIAMATVIGLSHNVFDGILCLGVCDKIVPGMLIGALEFGHLPTGFIPAGPMPTGLSNKAKSAARQRYAKGEIGRDALLEAESAAYHSPGTCTFYGTANSNQILMETLGIQLPGASFINPTDALRQPLTEATVSRVINVCANSDTPLSLREMITAESLVNAVVMLMTTGGSTNHTLHLLAIAQAAGIELRWEDFADISKVTPLLARIYPNGEHDINAFQVAGGTAFLFSELRNAGLLNEQVQNLMGTGLAAYELKPSLDSTGQATWGVRVTESALPDVLRPHRQAFSNAGGLTLLSGNLGTGVVKVSAVDPRHQQISAPCRIFTDQASFQQAFKQGELNQDVVVVLRFQGPKANGMPELHQLTPCLGVLQDQGYQVALVTDGRMSGASGKVLAVVHVSPESAAGGGLAKLRDGDTITLDAGVGTLQALIVANEWADRVPATMPAIEQNAIGRQLFTWMRNIVSTSETGASIFND